ncbi:MAG: hypothetical protein DWH81_15905 [Planctomycetota bacterium]|nr:MAG: hypothetical protein DWH81_15905 [Planctomycetota bacterium]
MVTELCLQDGIDHLKDCPFHTAILEVLNTNRALASASAFINPDYSWFAGAVLPLTDQFTECSGEFPPGTAV